MKKVVLTFCFLLFGVLSMFSQTCNLRFNLEKGNEYKIKQEVLQTTKQTINGEEQNVETKIVTTMAFNVKESTNDFLLVEVSVSDMFFSMKSPKVSMEYDSGKEPAQGDINGLLYSKMLGKKYSVLFDKKGEVKQVTGINELMTSILESMNISDANMKAQVMHKMEGMFGEKIIKGNMEVMTSIFPNKEVGVGSIWKNTVNQMSVMPVDYVNSWKLKSYDDGVASILGISSIVPVDKDKWKNVDGIPTKYELNGMQSANINVDGKTGWILSSSIESFLKGRILMGKCDRLPQGMEVPVEINTITKYKSLN